MVEITAKKDVTVTPMAVIEAPEMLQDVRNYFSEIDRPHVLIPLLTSVGKAQVGNTQWQLLPVSFLKNLTALSGSDP
ncbi:MAG: hypothetical protein R2778_14825 [Saprospiraceae bacterium]